MAMSKETLEVLHACMDSSTHYLEFGAGESTLYAAKAPRIKSIDSVESSEEYVKENLASNPAILHALSTGKLRFHIIDIGETREWGYPKDQSKKHLWPNYSLSVFSGKSDHDLVLVDGRFRVACALSSILNTSENCTIVIHDFWDRPEYHILLKFLEVRTRARSLGVFDKKRDVDPETLRSLLKKYQYLPR